MQLAAVLDLVLKSIVFVSEYVGLTAKVLHELQFDFTRSQQFLYHHTGMGK